MLYFLHSCISECTDDGCLECSADVDTCTECAAGKWLDTSNNNCDTGKILTNKHFVFLLITV